MNVNYRKFRNYNPTIKKPRIILPLRYYCCNYFENVPAKSLDSGAASLPGYRSWLSNCRTWGKSLMCLCFSFRMWKMERAMVSPSQGGCED